MLVGCAVGLLAAVSWMAAGHRHDPPRRGDRAGRRHSQRHRVVTAPVLGSTLGDHAGGLRPRDCAPSWFGALVAIQVGQQCLSEPCPTPSTLARPTRRAWDAPAGSVEPLAASASRHATGISTSTSSRATEPFDKPAMSRRPQRQSRCGARSDHHQYVKRWAFRPRACIAVWLPAAAIGLGCTTWWFHSIDKTMPVFRGADLPGGVHGRRPAPGMVERRPLVTAVALALLSAPARGHRGRCCAAWGVLLPVDRPPWIGWRV